MLFFVLLFCCFLSCLGADISCFKRQVAYNVTDLYTTSTDQDVALSIDTSGNVNCDEIRFHDQKTDTWLDYYVEGGCVGDSDVAWVTIASLELNISHLVVYYADCQGSVPLSTGSRITYSNKFFVLGTNVTNCPTGWSISTDFLDRFVYVSSSAFSLPLMDTNMTYLSNHVHTVNGTTYLTEVLPDGYTMFNNDTNMAWSSWDNIPLNLHTHSSISFLTNKSTGTTIPSYISLKFCESSSMFDISSVSVGLVSVYKSDFDSKVGDYIPLLNRLLRAGNSNEYGGADSHFHSFNDFHDVSPSNPPTIVWRMNDTNCLGLSSLSHAHRCIGQTESISNFPKTAKVKFGEILDSDYDVSNFRFFATGTPPKGWAKETSGVVMDTFLAGGPSEETFMGVNSGIHTISSDVYECGGQDKNILAQPSLCSTFDGSGNDSLSLWNHSHSLTNPQVSQDGWASPDQALPRVELILIGRKSQKNISVVSQCEDNYFGDGCNITTCYGTNSDESSSCGIHGFCYSYNKCKCTAVGYYGPQCNISACYDVLMNDTLNVCSCHGKCMSDGTCSCQSNYFGQICNVTTCSNIFNNDTSHSYCSGHGMCTEHEVCKCQRHYVGDECNITIPKGWNCIDTNYNSGDGCHCGCGVYDPDCDNKALLSNQIHGCNPPSGMVTLGCNPLNAQCEYTPWTCSSSLYNKGDEECDCGCGSIDPDCIQDDATINNCGGQAPVCNMINGKCDKGDETTLDDDAFNEGYDCDCGTDVAIDPDCMKDYYGGEYVFLDVKEDDEISLPEGKTVVCKVNLQTNHTSVSKNEWTCGQNTYFHRDGCHCDCGLFDPDCLDPTQRTICGNGIQKGLSYQASLPFQCVELGSPSAWTCRRIGWTCSPLLYNDKKTCNCECGVWDVDCDLNNTIDDNFYCFNKSDGTGKKVAKAWTCDPNSYDDGYFCNCGCGIMDPDCLRHGLPTVGCSSGEVCHANSTCVPECDQSLFGDGDGICHCNCSKFWGGLIDPDCLGSDKSKISFEDCGPNHFCKSDNDMTDPLCVPNGWSCNVSMYNDSTCDCGCNAWDVACDGYIGPANNCDPADTKKKYCSPADNQCHSCSHTGDIGKENGCNCGCDIWDPDCLNETTVIGCDSEDEGCYKNPDTGFGECKNIPTWKCWPGSYGTGDGCDCNCGIWDTDCTNPSGTENAKNCESSEKCHNIGGFGRCIPNNWTCDIRRYGGRDGCHCNCGAQDKDCNDPTQNLIGCPMDGKGQYCSEGKCKIVDPAPASWTCSKDIYYAQDACDCACGFYDPDCNNETLPVLNCEPEQGCGPFGQCEDFGEDPIPHGWKCPDDWYGTGDGCHCGCGGWDPDCANNDDDIGCTSEQSCRKIKEDNRYVGKCVWNLPIGWVCDSSFFYNGGGCNCSCGQYDPDCDNPSAKLYGCKYEYSKCMKDGTCGCRDHYFGDQCEKTFCDGVSSEMAGKVCTGKGKCWPKDSCTCHEPNDYFGRFCNITTCHGFLSNETDKVCGGHGKCFPKDVCQCHDNYQYSTEFCNTTSCGGILSNETDKVCNHHGLCTSFDECSCYTDEGDSEIHYFGKLCNITTCYSVWSNVSEEVCSGHGSCFLKDNCTCMEGYDGMACSSWDCFGKDWNKTLPQDLCGGRGPCIGKDKCDCQTGYYDNSLWYEGVLRMSRPEYTIKPCDIFKCHGVWNLDTKSACTGNGTCVGPNNCTCKSGYFGYNCGQFICFNVNTTSTSWDGTPPCSGDGTCVGGDKCECNAGMSGPQCEYHSCYGVTVKKGNDGDEICSGHGTCKSLDVCKCDSEWEGDECDVEILNYALLVGLPVGASSGGVLFVLFFICCLCCSCVCLIAGVIAFVIFLYSEKGHRDNFLDDDSDDEPTQKEVEKKKNEERDDEEDDIEMEEYEYDDDGDDYKHDINFQI